MLRSSLTFIAFSLAFFAAAQSTEALTVLMGGGSQQWSVIGNAPVPKCSSGDATYTFQESQVVVATCTGGAWKSRTEPLTTWSTGGKSGIAFGGARYEMKTLPSSAPACKGHATCVRLTTVPDGKSDATRSIYLTH